VQLADSLSNRRTRAWYSRILISTSTHELRNVGFCDVQETETTLPKMWAGSADLWEYQQEVSTLYVLYSKLSPQRCAQELLPRLLRDSPSSKMETG